MSDETVSYLTPLEAEKLRSRRKSLFVRMLLEQVGRLEQTDKSFDFFSYSRHVTRLYYACLVPERVAGVSQDGCDFVVVEELLEGGHRDLPRVFPAIYLDRPHQSLEG